MPSESEKFKQKYRIQSSRLKNYDYSQNGLYFITICAKDKEHFFGEIKNGEMELNEIGKIADQFWKEIVRHFSFVNLDVHQIMPNHMHGILEILRNDTEICSNADVEYGYKTHYGSVENVVETQQFRDVETQQCCVSTGHVQNETKSNTFYRLKPGSVSVIIRSYKSVVSKIVRKQSPRIGFAWQSRFYDRIIRNETELNKIREYIQKNPAEWERDRNNMENIWM